MLIFYVFLRENKFTALVILLTVICTPHINKHTEKQERNDFPLRCRFWLLLAIQLDELEYGESVEHSNNSFKQHREREKYTQQKTNFNEWIGYWHSARGVPKNVTFKTEHQTWFTQITPILVRAVHSYDFGIVIVRLASRFDVSGIGAHSCVYRFGFMCGRTQGRNVTCRFRDALWML